VKTRELATCYHCGERPTPCDDADIYFIECEHCGVRGPRVEYEIDAFIEWNEVCGAVAASVVAKRVFLCVGCKDDMSGPHRHEAPPPAREEERETKRDEIHHAPIAPRGRSMSPTCGDYQENPDMCVCGSGDDVCKRCDEERRWHPPPRRRGEACKHAYHPCRACPDGAPRSAHAAREEKP